MKLDPENYIDYVGYKVKLFPTDEQKEIFIKYFGVSRYVYNLAKDIYEDMYFGEDKSPSFIDINNEFTRLKNNGDKYKWIVDENYDAGSLKLSLKDLYNSYMKYNTGLSEIPKYRSIKKSSKQFPVRTERLSILHDVVRLPSIGYVKYYNSYDDNIIGTGYASRLDKSLKYLKYVSARVIYDGIDYWLTFSLPKDQTHQPYSYQYYMGNEEWKNQNNSEAIGIDVGLKHEKWFIDSTGYVLKRPDSSKYYKKLDLLYKKLHRQYVTNINREPRLFKDRKAPINGQSKNMQKTKEKINKYYKKITNRRRNSIYDYCNYLLDQKPKAVVMEGLDISNSIIIHDYNKLCDNHMKGINLLTQDAALYDSMKIIERKMMSNGISVMYADQQYPSSQICSRCGHRQKIDRKETYKCPECGLVINRDLNAALNLKKLAYLKCPVVKI